MLLVLFVFKLNVEVEFIVWVCVYFNVVKCYLIGCEVSL